VRAKARFVFRDELVPVVTGFVSGGGGIGVAARAGCRVLVTGLVAVDVT
jgi:hypothetical protein